MAKPMLVYIPRAQFFDNAGAPLSGGKVFFYQPGTITKLNTYTDRTVAVANPNPIILDTAGRPSNNGSPIDIYVTQAYKMVVAPSTDTDPPGSPIWTEDNVTTIGQINGVASTKIANYSVVQSDRDYLIPVDASSGNITVTLLSAITAGSGYTISFKKIDSSANTVTIQGYSAETIDGSNTRVISNQYDTVAIESDGTLWYSLLTTYGAVTAGTAGQNIRIGASTGVLTHKNAVHFENVSVTTASGSFVVPTDVSLIKVQMWGAGGGAGGSTATKTGGSGGGGAYLSKMLAVTPGQTLTLTIGALGAGGATTVAGSSGGDTILTGSGITTLTAGGGVGGTVTTNANSAGGTATNGDENISGGPGGQCINAASVGIAGGNSPRGGAGGIAGLGIAGAAGTIPGGGGGAAGTLVATGGAGARGQIVIEY